MLPCRMLPCPCKFASHENRERLCEKCVRWRGQKMVKQKLEKKERNKFKWNFVFWAKGESWDSGTLQMWLTRTETPKNGTNNNNNNSSTQWIELRRCDVMWYEGDEKESLASSNSFGRAVIGIVLRSEYSICSFTEQEEEWVERRARVSVWRSDRISDREKDRVRAKGLSKAIQREEKEW